MERRLVAELGTSDAVAFHDTLSQAGFRRSHRFAYVPVCRDCSACATVRILAQDFRPRRSHRRLLSRNSDLKGKHVPPVATAEQYELFRSYQAVRHGGGEMARMDFFDYQALVEDTPVDTSVIEFRNPQRQLVAACISDRVADGFSAVYSFFRPDMPKCGLGSYMILWLIERACALTLPHVYLGFWVAECPKMAYKASFQPLEAYTPEGWRPLRVEDPDTWKYFRSTR